MNRSAVAISTLLLLAGCGKAPSDDARQAEGPTVNVTAAPGVAFTYAYLFTLPPAGIASVQEAHAQACERLGVARCRITGMTYTVRDADRVDASLSFRLAPALARAFGRQGVATVEAADGMLSSAAIEGTDVGGEIAAADAQNADAAGDRTRIEQETAQATGQARAELIRQRAALDDAARAWRATARAQQDRLAATPVTFSYASGQAIRSLHARSPIVRAADTAIASVQTTLSFLLQGIALLVPPLAALALLWLAWRAVGRRSWAWLRGPKVDDAA